MAVFVCSLCGAETEEEQGFTWAEIGFIDGGWHQKFKNTYSPPVEVNICCLCYFDKSIVELFTEVRNYFESGNVAGWKPGKGEKDERKN